SRCRFGARHRAARDVPHARGRPGRARTAAPRDRHLTMAGVPSFEERVELVRRTYDAFHRGDVDAMLTEIHSEVEWCVDAAIPGAVQIYRGHDGLRKYLAE